MIKTENELFTKKVYAGSRIYFFDVRRNNDKTMYLTVTENKFNGENERPEKFRILIYEDKLRDFIAGFNEAINFMKDEMFNLAHVLEE